MAFERDHDTMCLVLPLKLGVGVAAVVVWAHSFLCMLALITGDIALRPTGYNQSLWFAPPVVGSCGIVFGFVGLLGTYDDKWELLWWFNRYFALKVLVLLAAYIADYWTLRQCESWRYNPEKLTNPFMAVLSDTGFCPWGRWSFVVGSGVEFTVWLYLFVRCLVYERQIANNPPYAVSFGGPAFGAQMGAHARWELFKVKDPWKGLPIAPAGQEVDPFSLCARPRWNGDGQRRAGVRPVGP